MVVWVTYTVSIAIFFLEIMHGKMLIKLIQSKQDSLLLLIGYR